MVGGMMPRNLSDWFDLVLLTIIIGFALRASWVLTCFLVEHLL